MEEGLSYSQAKRLAIKRIREIQKEPLPAHEPAIIESETIERPWGWVVHWNTQLFLDTGDFEHALWGTPPLCINKQDQSVTPLVCERPLTREIREYERRIGARPWWKRW